MNRKETAIIMGILKTAYPYYYKDLGSEESREAVTLWHEMFKDDDVSIVKAAVKALIASDTKGFPPVIGQVKEEIYKITNKDAMTQEEAWLRVKKAMNFYDAAECFSNLPPILKELVGSANQLKEWSQIDIGTLDTVVKSNFIRSYAVKVQRAKEDKKIPSDVRKLMKGIQSVNNAIGLKEGESIEPNRNES